MEHGMLPGDVAYVNQTQNNRVGQAANPQATGWRNGKKDLDDSDDEWFITSACLLDYVELREYKLGAILINL